jgi:hypothetical protein
VQTETILEAAAVALVDIKPTLAERRCRLQVGRCMQWLSALEVRVVDRDQAERHLHFPRFLQPEEVVAELLRLLLTLAVQAVAQEELPAQERQATRHPRLRHKDLPVVHRLVMEILAHAVPEAAAAPRRLEQMVC